MALRVTQFTSICIINTVYLHAISNVFTKAVLGLFEEVE